MASSLVSDSTGGVPINTPTSTIASRPKPTNQKGQQQKSKFSARDEIEPQPGRFPIVFQAGASAPVRTEKFSLNGQVICDTLKDIPQRYVNQPGFATFSNHSGLDDTMFTQGLNVVYLLSLAQQLVFSHINMRLPVGNFFHLTAVEMPTPQSITTILSQYGEFISDTFGTRYTLANYETTILSLVRCANKVYTEREGKVESLKKLWLPTSPSDTRTRHIVAVRLASLFKDLGIWLDIDDLSDSVFNQPNDRFNALRGLLGGLGTRFDFLFNRYDTAAAFATALNSNAHKTVLQEIGLPINSCNQGDLDWGYDFSGYIDNLTTDWFEKFESLDKYFKTSSTLSQKATARGTFAQFTEIKKNGPSTLLSSSVALPSGENSLAVCFPVTVYHPFRYLYAKQTTSEPIGIRSTQFQQRDWK